MARLKLLAGIALAFMLAACASDNARSFEIRTIDTEGQPVPCAIIVEGDVYPDPDDPEKPLLTNDHDKPLRLTYDRERSGEFEVIEVRVRAFERNEKNKIIPGSWKTDPNPYLMTESTRRIRHNDSRIHLFILRPNPNYSGS